jgi:Pyruvate/2-oxoacid:ferredoxin oxidoreductase delta subunit/predicted transcriptional regulator
MVEKTACEQLASAIGAADSKILPAIFEALTDEDEARLLLAAAPPATVEEISKRSGLEAEAVARMIDPLFRKGLIFKSKKHEETRYYRVRHVLQFHDATAVALDPPREMLDLWKRYMEEEWDEYGRKFEAALPGSVLRVIPVNESIEPDSQILAFEDLEKLVHEAHNFAVTRCSCRVIDGSCGKPLEVCLQINRAADYAIERGTGRQLTKQETLEMLRQCEDEGLVHVADNRRSLGHVICNCCSDCCLNWTSLRTGLGKFVAPSRFRASVDDEECNGCALCVDRCFFDAMTMQDEGALVAVDAENCMGCGSCQVVCPTDAISLQVARSQEFVPA